MSSQCRSRRLIRYLLLAAWPALLLGSLSCSNSDEVTNPATGSAPTLNSVDPEVAAFGDASVMVTFTGEGFVKESVAMWWNTPLPTVYMDSETLQATLPDTFLLDPGDLDPDMREVRTSLWVSNAATGGGDSDYLRFTVKDPYPVPAIDSLEPDTLVAGEGPVGIAVHGSGFAPDSRLLWDGFDLAITTQTGNLLRAGVPANLLDGGDSIQVQVVNPPPVGGPSNTMFARIENTVPTYVSHDPAGLPVGHGDGTITITGTGFVPSTYVTWNGEAKPTTYVDQWTVSVTIPDSNIVAAPPAVVVIVNPEPVGGQSDPFEVTNYVAFGEGVTDLIHDQVRNAIWVAIPTDGRTFSAGVYMIDDATGAVEIRYAGGGCDLLAMTDDGQYLYVGLRESGQVLRREIGTGQPDLYLELGPHWSSGDPLKAWDMVPLVGSPGSVAVSASDEYRSHPAQGTNTILVFDNDVRRSLAAPAVGTGQSPYCDILEPTIDPNVLVTTLRASPAGLMRVQLTTEGARIMDEPYVGPAYEDLHDLHAHGGRIYADGSPIFDESLTYMQGFQARGPMTVDTAVSHAYFLAGSTSAFDVDHDRLKVFDLVTLAQLGEVVIGGAHPATMNRLLKVGSDGLAFRSSEGTVRLYRNPVFAGGK